MNVELKKIKKTIFFTGLIVVVAVSGLIWFLTRAFVSVAVSPRNAIVYLDGKKLKTSLGEVPINASTGEHSISIEADNYVGQNKTVVFNRGFNKKLEVNLSSVGQPALVNENTRFLSKGDDFNAAYYLSDQTLYKTKVGLNDQGSASIVENRAITDNVIKNVNEIIWSPTKQLALFRKSNGKITIFDFMKYDFVHQTETAWGSSDIGSIAWAPDNSRIAYYYTTENGEKSLIFTNVQNKSQERVANFAKLGIENPILKWSPDSQWLLVIPRNKDYDKNKIYLFNAYLRTIKAITDTGGNLDANFSPDGNKILYSTYSKTEGNPVTSILLIMDKDGNNKRDLGVRADLDKVEWSKDSQKIVVATLNQENNGESIFLFDTSDKQKDGFSINNLGTEYVDNIVLSDDVDILMYEAGGRISAIKVN